MERPALKRLLADVQSGAVNCVVVYKVDRLSRSLLDFARMMEIFEKNGTSFVSVTQQLNSASSMGRLTLNVLLSFAQFEREMISERTRDKMGAARRRGKWVGGNPVLGYDVAPQGGSLVVNPDEAQRVRDIFRLYLELGSLIPVVEELNRRGWRMKSWTTREGRKAGGKPIPKNSLYNLLTNIIYVGKVEYDSQIYEGEHERIVDDETWNKVQSELNRNGRRGGRNIGNKYSALLKGLVRCGTCNVGMIHTYVNKKDKLYRYYVCVKAHQRGWAQCETRSVSAPAIENAVIEQLRGVGSNPAMLHEVRRQLDEQHESTRATVQHEKAEIERELKDVGRKVNATAALLGTAGPAAELATDRLAELQGQTSHLESRLTDVCRKATAVGAETIGSADLKAALSTFDSLWEQLSGWEQERFIQTLVQEVRYDGKSGTVTLAFASPGLKEICRRETASSGAV
jgi:site-specific DNA recombinase